MKTRLTDSENACKQTVVCKFLADGVKLDAEVRDGALLGQEQVAEGVALIAQSDDLIGKRSVFVCLEVFAILFCRES